MVGRVMSIDERTAKSDGAVRMEEGITYIHILTVKNGTTAAKTRAIIGENAKLDGGIRGANRESSAAIIVDAFTEFAVHNIDLGVKIC